MFYTRIDQRFDTILLRGIDNNGKRMMHRIKYKPYIYTNSTGDKQDAVDCVNKLPLQRLDFNSISDLQDHIKRMSNVEGYRLYGNKNPVTQFTAKHFQGETKWDIDKINGAIIDIEYFPAAKNELGEYMLDGNGDFVMLRMADNTTTVTPFPVNAVTVYNWNEKTFYTFGLEVLEGKELGTYKHDDKHPEVGACKVIYKGYQTEKELLMHLALHLEANAYDFYSGWNFKCFDLPYLINRTNLVCGESYSKKYSPWGIVKEREVRGEYSSRISYDVFGVSILDYQDLLKKHGFINPDNWKLSTVSQFILGKDKLDAGSDFINDYLNHYQNFIEYNIQDVNLVAQIDIKKNFFSLMFAMAYISNSQYDDMLGTIKPWSNYLYTAYHGIGQEPLLKKIPKEVPVLDGGYVKEPQKGFHKWLISLDLNSLYPHLMQMYNMGIETIVEYESCPSELKELYATNLVETLLSTGLSKDIKTALNKHNMCLTAYGIPFRINEPSMLYQRTKALYTDRARIKKEASALYREAKNCNNNAIKATILADAGLKSVIQNAYKIFLNSGYGAIGNKYFAEYFNYNIAESITLSGQLAIQFVAARLNAFMNTKLSTQVIDYIDYIAYGDTDSLYFRCDIWVAKYHANKTPDELCTLLNEFVNNEIQPVIDKAYKDLAGMLNAEPRMFMKREKIIESGIWLEAKKRYAMLIKEDEDCIRYDPPELSYTGLDAKRGEFPRVCRDWLETTYQLALEDNREALTEFVGIKEAEYHTLPLDIISKPKGINGLEKYEYLGNGRFTTRTPSHVKASLLHNHLVIELGLSTPLIKSGDKIKLVQLVDNPFNIELIAYIGELPKEFELHEYIDFHGSFKKNFLNPLDNFLTAVNWDYNIAYDINDFLF